MKKLFILALLVLVGISLCLSNLKADQARTIPMKSGVALATDTIIVGHGGTLYKVTGLAAGAANAMYSIHDTAEKVLGPLSTNTLCEGGEANQYDSFDTIDFGDEGIAFNTGLTIITSTAHVCVLYR